MPDRSAEAVGRSGATIYADREAAGIERAGTMLVELGEATRSAAEALLEEQKQRAAAQARGFAEAVRSAAQHLERSESWGIGDYAHQAAGQIEQLSNLIGQRNWSEILTETRDFARRRPWLFLGAAMAAGFAAGRVLLIPADRKPAQLSAKAGETAQVTAAVSSGDGRFTAQHTDISAGLETH
jgi:ElaB/YqjD/DUF883 family membrane-anchored ribosome-binding protein